MGGGGEFVRSAAKMAGIGVINAGHRGSSSSIPKLEQLLRGKSKPTTVAAAASSSPSLQHAKAGVGVSEVESIQRPTWEIDDWDFVAFEDDLAYGQKPRIVFGPAPSFEEAKEATVELKEALDQVYLTSLDSSESASSSNDELVTKSCLVIESSPRSSVPNNALEAFKLLQENTQVQTVVASIASDHNVWNAMMDNEEVKRFMKSYKTNVLSIADEGLQSEKLSDELKDAPDDNNDKESRNFFSDAVGYIKTKIAGMVVRASGLLQKIFGSPEDEVSFVGPGIETTGSTFAERAVGVSIMGLVVIVVMVMLAKRN